MNGEAVEELEHENKNLKMIIKKLRFDHEESKVKTHPQLTRN